MSFYLDRMLWCPFDKVNVPRLQAELTVTPKVYMGVAKPVELFEMDEGTVRKGGERGFIGVPRNWGIRQRWLIGDSEPVDGTVASYKQWPDVRFPGDGWYWKGQEESVDALVNVFARKQGALLEAPCASGKTLMGLSVAARLNTPILIMVHKEDLARQWWDTAKMFFPGATVGHVQGDKWDCWDKHLVTATAQTLYRRMHYVTPEFWKHFGMVIYDEGHRYPARTFEAIMKKPYARFRLGVSATWRRKDGLECVWYWHVGRIEHRTIATRLTGKYKQVGWSTELEDSLFRMGKKVNHSQWITALARNVKYNKWLAEQLGMGAGAGRRVLCISDRIDQLKTLRKWLLQRGGVTVGMYVGALNGKRVEKMTLEVAKTCDIILATYQKMAEGTDIPELDTLFFGTPRADVEQVVGRIQRHGDKKGLLIVDPVVNTGYMERLGAKRVKVYEKLGFLKQGEA